MATISITIPDAIIQRVLDGVCYNNNYQDTLIDPTDETKTIPNPETKAHFAKNQLKIWAKLQVVEYEANHAADVARQAAIIDAATDITIGD